MIVVEIKPWGDHLAHFMDNNEDFLIFSDGHVLRIGYPPSWDIENVCFLKSKTDDQRFYYTILSKNNRKRFEGTVIVEKENEYTRLRQFADHAAFRAKFSKTELSSSSFCKSIEKVPLQEALLEEKHHYSLQTDYEEAARKSPITAQLYAELKTL
ncbi:hypothetical protein HA402_010378 [Bradysia odoriphaga]|nr:hypothetical protein HA402_010378 [Bradysia odoriphaga]